MLTFSVTADWTLEPGAEDWLVQEYIPAQFQKAMALYREERTELRRAFDPNLREALSGRVHIHLHPSDWEYQPGWWIAGIYRIDKGPRTPDDGAGFVDLIEASWKHDFQRGWDTLEHEFGHFIAYRHIGNLETHRADWTNFGHGNLSDPYLQAVNSKVKKAYPSAQLYFPGLLPNRTYGLLKDGGIQPCGVLS